MCRFFNRVHHESTLYKTLRRFLENTFRLYGDEFHNTTYYSFFYTIHLYSAMEIFLGYFGYFQSIYAVTYKYHRHIYLQEKDSYGLVSHDFPYYRDSLFQELVKQRLYSADYIPMATMLEPFGLEPFGLE